MVKRFAFALSALMLWSSAAAVEGSFGHALELFQRKQWAEAAAAFGLLDAVEVRRGSSGCGDTVERCASCDC